MCEFRALPVPSVHAPSAGRSQRSAPRLPPATAAQARRGSRPWTATPLGCLAAGPTPCQGPKAGGCPAVRENCGLERLEASRPRVSRQAVDGRGPGALRSLDRGSRAWGAGIPRADGPGWAGVSMAGGEPYTGRGRAGPSWLQILTQSAPPAV